MAGYDLAIVGAGIVGLGCALAAARTGKRVVVIDRDAQANGASIRNFGFITVTGQQRGACWRRAMRSRDVWEEVAPPAGIPIVQRGLLAGRAPPGGGAGARSLPPHGDGRGLRAARRRNARRGASRRSRGDCAAGAVQPARAARRIARRRSRSSPPGSPSACGVTFLRGTAVRSAAPPRLETSRGAIEADAVIVCPGRRFPQPARGPHRRLRSDPLQAADAARAAARRLLAAARR